MASLLSSSAWCARLRLSLVASLTLLSISARAATFTVTNSANSGAGSLRAAIDSANASTGADTINFNIPTTNPNYSAATGVVTIRPLTALPPLTGGAIIIDGTTQTTSRGNTNNLGPEIELATSANSSIGTGLALNSNSNSIKGLIISGFDTGIGISNGSSNRIESCYLGTDRTGNAAGAFSNAKNLVILGADNIIGSVGAGNRIGFGSSSGGGSGGVQISGRNNDLTANTIFSNAGAGLYVTGGTGHTFSQNSIFSNSTLGISLNSSGSDVASPNDAGDFDTGNNNRQNFPVITSVSESDGNTLVSGTLGSSASASFTIELFRNTPTVGSDPTGFGEGEIYVASTSVGTNTGGNGTFAFSVPSLFATGTSFSATATRDTTGDTSEFGPAMDASGLIGSVTNTLDSGVGSLRTAILRANAINSSPPTSISFNIPTTDGGFNPATGVASITVQTALPILSANNTIIDGTTQTLNRGDTNTQGPEIALVPAAGLSSGSIFSGLRTSSSNSVFRSLIISGFGTGVLIDNGNNNRVEGCYLGTNATGTAANSVRNQRGIYISGSNNLIGGSGVGAGNLIAFGSGSGVEIVSGNNDDLIGNSVFSNLDRGVQINTGTNHTILQNSIYSNGSLGIDLLGSASTSSVNRNDVGDADAGANNGQNYPLIASVSENGGATLVSGTLNSTPSSSFTIELFRNTPAVGPDATGFGEGEIISGSTAISTDAAGNSSWSFSIPGTFASGTTFSTTATSTATGDTSEFGPARSLLGDASIVTNTADSGVGSLRTAINFANGLADAVISFNIPPGDSGFNSSTGVATIALQSQLPILTSDGTTINGETQSSNRGNSNPLGPEISIVPAANQFISNGLQVDSNNNTIRGLIISGFSSGVRFIRSGNRVLGCYIGTDYTGTAPGNARNDTGINNIGSGNSLGGLNLGEGNRIGFNRSWGVFLSVSGGDTVGSDVVGNVIFSNGNDGIVVIGGSGNTFSQNSIFNNGNVNNVFSNQGINLGGNRVVPNDAGDADTGANNLQNYPAIKSVEESGANTLVSGTLNSTPSSNFTIELFRNTPAVGPDATGFGEGEVFIVSTSISTDGNGNASFSFVVPGTFAAGTTFTATATHLGTGDTSGFSNALALGDTPGLVINTLDSGTGSLRSALAFATNFPNSNVSFSIPPSDSGFNSATGVATITVQSQLPTFSGSGILIDGSTQSANRGNTNPFGPEVALATSASGAINLGLDMGGSNNVVKGLIVSGFNTGVSLNGSNNRLEASYIGTDHTGNAAGSVRNGKGVTSYTSNNLIGGLSAAASNRIGFNQGRGVELAGTNNDAFGNVIFSNGNKGITILSGNGHTLSQNSIFGNGGLGISLTTATDGVTPNDAGDGDADANNRQNFPIITNATIGSGTLTIEGTLSSIPNRSFVIEYFSSTEADPSGNGEGQTFLGSQTVTTDGSGVASINTSFSSALGTGFISSTATYAQNNASITGASPGDTSEFGPAVAIRQLPSLSINDVEVTEGNSGSTNAVFTVTLSAASSQTVTVSYGTEDGTALSGSDYTSTSGTLTFAPGETIKTLSVPIISDTAAEPNETFLVNLSGAGGGTISDAQGIGTIVNDDMDVSASISVFRSGASRNRATGRTKETLILKNTSNVSVSGPFYLVVDNLSANATLFNASGMTTTQPPLGSPYLTIPIANIPAGASQYVVLEFTVSNNSAYSFTPRILAGSNAP